MVKEVDNKQEKECKPVEIPIAVLTRKGKVLALREDPPQKYAGNEWMFLMGRVFLGEQSVAHLINFVKEVGFSVDGTEEIGRDKGTKDDNYSAGRPVAFVFFKFKVKEGEFHPKIMKAGDYLNSPYNFLSRCRAQWFTVSQLKKQTLHPLAAKALEKLDNAESRNISPASSTLLS